MNRCWAFAILLGQPALTSAEEANYFYFQADRLEHQVQDELSIWDMQGWYGNDEHKFWWKLEGSDDQTTRSDVQLLYSRALTPWFDIQAGALVEFIGSDHEVAAIAGLQGMAPYGLELDVAVYLSENGTTGLKAEVERDFYLTQTLVMQPRIEFQDSSAEKSLAAFGFRFRYELSRQFAPYVGASWQHSENDDSEITILAGLRFWF